MLPSGSSSVALTSRGSATSREKIPFVAFQAVVMRPWGVPTAALA